VGAGATYGCGAAGGGSLLPQALTIKPTPARAMRDLRSIEYFSFRAASGACPKGFRARARSRFHPSREFGASLQKVAVPLWRIAGASARTCPFPPRSVRSMSVAMQRTERLFALTEYLRGRRTGVTAEVLAERFGVTLRTIYRDLDTLRMAALPLSAERGRGGGYALDRSYSLPPVNFTAREAALLVALGRFAIEMRLLPFAETLDSALDKVRAALSTSAQRELLTRLSELSFHGVPGLPTKKAVRSALERAWFEQCPLRIVYVDGNFIQSTRTVRILGVLMERHETRLDAVDIESGERRHFRLDRVEQAEVVRVDPTPAAPTFVGKRR
jgi:predicted DNA-binding transcriptional regulator YafY